MARKTLEDLISELEDDVAAAFVESIRDIRSDAQFRLVVNALERGDIERVIELLNIDGSYFAPLDAAMRQSYEAGGAWAMGEMQRMARAQGARLTARFDTMNPRAREYIANRSSALITEVSDQTKSLARNVIAQGLDENRSYRSIALDLVGRYDGTAKRRVGGIIGLTSGEQANAQRAYNQLVSGDPAELAKYLKREVRDKRFDSVVYKAIRTGQPVPAAQAAAMKVRMEDMLMERRGLRISRTELLTNINAANDQGVEQLIQSGRLAREDVVNVWDSSEDKYTRDSHVFMDGQRQQQGTPFRTGSGYLLLYPGDRTYGAPASEVIHCRCYLRREIDFLAQLGR